MKRIRLQIGLRLMLLLVALFCVLAAYHRASLDMWRENNLTRLNELENRQQYLSVGDGSIPQVKSKLTAVNAEIDKIRQQLGQSENNSQQHANQTVPTGRR